MKRFIISIMVLVAAIVRAQVSVDWTDIDKTGSSLSHIATRNFADLQNKPTTLGGYGITDSVVLSSASYANPSWLTAVGWSKVTGTPTTLAGYGITDAATQSALAQTSNSRAPMPGLVFDGSAGTTLTGVPALGAYWTVSAHVNVAAIPSTLYPITGGGTGAAVVYISHELAVILTDNTGLSVVGPTIAVGKSYNVAVVHDAANAYFYLDGALAATVADANTYSGAITSVGSDSSFKYAGAVFSVCLYNRALSAAEVATLYRDGVPAASDFNNASATPFYAADFSAGTYGWHDNAAGSCAVVGGVSAPGSVAASLQVSRASGGAGTIQVKDNGLNGAVVKNAWYLVELDYYADVGAAVPYLGIGLAWGLSLNVGGNLPLVEGAWQYGKRLLCRIDTEDAFNIIGCYSLNGPTGAQIAAGKSIYLKNIRVTRLGLIGAWDMALGAGTSAPALPGVLCGPITGIDGTHVRWSLPRSLVIPGPVTVTGNVETASQVRAAAAVVPVIYSNALNSGDPITICAGDGGSGTNAVLIKNINGSLTVFSVRGDGRVTFGGGSAIKTVRTALVTHDFGTVAVGSISDTTVTVTGAQLGDSVLINTSDTVWGGGVLAEAQITGPNTVYVRLFNPTTNTYVAGSRTFRVTVISF